MSPRRKLIAIPAHPFPRRPPRAGASYYSEPRYLLGTGFDERTFEFTDLGPYQSGFEAVAYAKTQRRMQTWCVIEERDVYRLGVCYGLHKEIVATVPPSQAHPT